MAVVDNAENRIWNRIWRFDPSPQGKFDPPYFAPTDPPFIPIPYIE